MSVIKATSDHFLPTMRLLENGDDEPHIVLNNIKESVDELLFCHISELEESLKHVIPSVIKAMQQIYAKNNLIVESDKGAVVELIRTNLQVALNFMDISSDILEIIMKNRAVPFSQVPSVPVNMAYILFLTFEHCKYSQKTYNSYYKSVSEILDLFRKTQGIHTRFLNFLDTNLIFDFLNQTEVIAHKEILDIIVKISKTLLGVNMKSMADNWKGFISLIQKASEQNVAPINLSLAIQVLTEEINNNLLTVFELESADPKKSSHNFKLIGFLMKVGLKLFEINLNVAENCEDIVRFCIVIYSWHVGFFQTNKFAGDIVDSVNTLFDLCSESVVSLLCRDSRFLKQFCLLYESFLVSEQSFGFLMFTITLLSQLPNVVRNDPKMLNDFNVVSLIQQVLNLTRNYYTEYFCDYNSDFYEELIISISVTILLFPNQFFEVEKTLLEYVVEDKIWTSLIATDIWCLVLRYSSESTCRSTLSTLIKKLEELKLGRFQQTPATVRLTIFTQRIFKMLSNTARNDELSSYNPTANLLVWKILNFRNIPVSHRYYVDFLMCDIIDKMDIVEREDHSLHDTLRLMEALDIMSYTKFNDLEVTAARLVPLVVNLWSFDMGDMSPNNNFFRYFVYKLAKVTTAVTDELTGGDLLLVLTQLKPLLSQVLFKFLSCDIMHGVSRRNFNNCHESSALYSLSSDIFQTLLTDKNSVVVQVALGSFLKMSESQSSIVHKVLIGSSDIRKMISDFKRKSAADTKYNVHYFEKIRSSTYQHHCREWSSAYQPVCKKIKIENETDFLISNLKNDTMKLLDATDKSELNARQRMDVQSVINKLGKLLN